MPTIGQTRPSTKQQESEEIERLTREYLRKGGTVDQADLRETKHVDLTFRHYSKAAMEGVR
ncbi:MAG: hypothetical protein CMP20_12210 [Rickettsiales bacterium]|nr:hypothetical protein [Rickettsiales bacterium]